MVATTNWTFRHILNRQLSACVSPSPETQAYAVDAVSISWDYLSAYAFPPFPDARTRRQTLSPAKSRPPVPPPSAHHPSTSRELPSSRLALVQRSLQKKGFSEEFGRLIVKPQRHSSSQICDSKWVRFSRWCDRRTVICSYPLYN